MGKSQGKKKIHFELGENNNNNDNNGSFNECQINFY